MGYGLFIGWEVLLKVFYKIGTAVHIVPVEMKYECSGREGGARHSHHQQQPIHTLRETGFVTFGHSLTSWSNLRRQPHLGNASMRLGKGKTIGHFLNNN